jgi:hypothetical protein
MHPVLDDLALWKRANEALTTRNKRGYVNPETRAMLAEALFCPFCEDSPMYRHRAQGRKQVYFYYRCAGRGRQRNSCGNQIRVDLADAAVTEIMASTFDVPVMRHEIVYGNETEIEAELERIRFELKQLAARELDWEEEDRERARLRAAHDRVASTQLIEDRVELVETDDTYLELWERLSDPARGPWLAEHGFRVTASKERVTVSQGPVLATVELSRPNRLVPVRDNEPVYQGKCECGCGTDLYGSRYGSRKKFVDQAHARKAAYLRHEAGRR